ncbi:MAG: glycoside hydrolase family 3 protein [Lachnospiraceae bacterium]|nr:glycoside hydrolase family 3 protein [Lachnospiraceae bacterium]
MGKIWNKEQYAQTAAKAAAEGVVLLKNDRAALPLKEGEKVAVFGRSQFNYYKSGTGSGGSVNVDYVIGIWEALEEARCVELNQTVRKAYETWIESHPFDAGHGWASEPWYQEEMPVEKELAEQAARESDAALILIGRTAGEDQDNKAEAGSYLLTEAERDLLRTVCGAFKRTIVLLNTGNIIDMKWVAEFDPAAVACVWQGGQEGGRGVRMVLMNECAPSGKLTDTIAADISDYPSTACFGNAEENLQQEDIYVGYRYFETFAKDKVLYPFGFGLSYTTFELKTTGFEEEADGVSLRVQVTNTGTCAGKEVVQVYAEAPQGQLGKPARVLCGYAKTGELAPGASEEVVISVPDSAVASYDEKGLTGFRSAFVLEAGEYTYYAGSDVRSAQPAGIRTLEETCCVQQCSEGLAPVKAFRRMRPGQQLAAGEYELAWEDVPLQTVTPGDKRNAALPEDIQQTGDLGYKLQDAAEGRITMEQFVGQISDAGLCAIIRGEGMSSPKVTPGIAAAYGGVTDELLGYGLPIAGCSDGPSGIRMDCGMHAFSMPNGTCLACSFNPELIEELYAWEGLELRRNKIDALLGPGMNIHRNPLNGRNFEYFSEDPFVSGKMAVAQLQGMHRYGVTGVVKHFAANTQEFKRHTMNSVASERALREIYLKGFEMAVREGGAYAVMSTYGPVNGIWTSSSYDLLTQILRQEWGFDGIVMTDWWAQANDEAGAPGTHSNVAAQVRAQNDLNMVNQEAASNSNGDNLDTALAEGLLTRGELQRSAMNICRYLLKTPAYLRSIGQETKLDRELAESLTDEDQSMQNAVTLMIDGDTEIDVNAIRAEKGQTTVFTACQERRGNYELELVLRADSDNPLAQIPVTVFMNKDVLKTITLTGSDNEWKTERIPVLPGFSANFFLKFYFGQTGIVLKSAKLILTEDTENKIREILASLG